MPAGGLFGYDFPYLAFKFLNEEIFSVFALFYFTEVPFPYARCLRAF